MHDTGTCIHSALKGTVFCEVAYYQAARFPFLIYVLDGAGRQHSQWHDNPTEAEAALAMYYAFGAFPWLTGGQRHK